MGPYAASMGGMDRALTEARRVGVVVEAMEPDAPAALFVVGSLVLYRPTGHDALDEALVLAGIASAEWTKCSGSFPQPISVVRPRS